MSLISPDSDFQLAAVLLALAAFGFWAESKPLGRKLSGVLIILFIGLLFSNINLIPHSTPMYDRVSSMLVPMAIPLLLFRANLKQVLREIGPMLKAFIASALVVSVSVIAIASSFDFGPFEAEVSGALAASYIGGSLNFVATAQAMELTDPNHYVAALTADALGAVWFLALLIVLPSLAIARKAMPSRYYNDSGQPVPSAGHDDDESGGQAFDILGCSAALATSMIICAVSDVLARALGIENLFVLIITILALAVANYLRPLTRRFSGEFEVGTLFMYVFFVTIGASADLASMAGVALPYVILIYSAVFLFMVLIIIVGRLLKLDLAELMIAANACILGPPTAAAMAAGFGWKDLVTPGVLAGILGYSVATFIGVAIAQILL